ncbi:MAG: molybdopterin molybdenumtransferase MoeA [Gammaproteobacteria bacterium]|nr:MAG: molybdopterin molybdenumtransferase MoeA [Gammaproteobacteria bacterium]
MSGATRPLPVETARRRLLEAVTPVADVETVPLAQACGRVLAEPLHAPCDLPHWDNSAMDGYALAADGAGAAGEIRLPVIGRALAGHPYRGAVPAGACVRITTGAALPEGTDTVIIQEKVRREGDTIVFEGPLRRGENVRRAGEDLRAGEVAVARGRWLTPLDIALLAALGLAAVPVRRRPRIAVLSSGDELVPAGTPLPPGGLYDSNGPMLAALLARLPVEVEPQPPLGDDPAAIETRLRALAGCCDALLSTGGVSVGDADHIADVLARIGRIEWHKVAIKPGKPLLFGRIDGTPFFGLPGNPVSAAVTFLVLLRPALLRLAGVEPPPEPLRLTLPLARAVQKRPGRSEYLRGRLIEADGGLQFEPFAAQGSHRLAPLSQAEALAELAADRGDTPAGTPVPVWPLQGLL